MENKRLNIYVFLDNVPFASEGILFGLENNKRCRVKSFYPKKYTSKRKNVDMETTLKNCFPIDYSTDLEGFEKQEKESLPGALFISFGYIHSSFSWASKLSRKYKGRCFVISERPTCVRKFRLFKTPVVLLKHAILRAKVQKKIDKLFATGDSSVRTFLRLGWNKNKVVSYFYCPLIHENEIKPSDDSCFLNKTHNDFIYSGRITYRSKSPQRLISYFAKHKEDRLFVIGDYGDDRDRFISRCKPYKNIVFLGSKSFATTINYFKTVDCILIPSSVDGWNINVNLALYAKTPCIITNNSGSDQIIAKNGNGIVCSNFGRSFRKAITAFSKNPSPYKEKANACDVITPELAAKIIIDEYVK